MQTNELTPTLEASPLVDAMPTDETSPIIDPISTDEALPAPESITPIPTVSFDDLLRVVHILARSEKFRLLQFVVAELAEYEKEESLTLSGTYEVWSPLDAYDAANALSEYLEAHKGSPDE